jgi:hypothetical protein
MAISAAGGVDGMAIIDMAWRINPDVRVFTLDTGRLPPETYTLFEEIREKYGIDVEFEFPDRDAVEKLVTAEGPNLMYKSVDLRLSRTFRLTEGLHLQAMAEGFNLLNTLNVNYYNTAYGASDFCPAGGPTYCPAGPLFKEGSPNQYYGTPRSLFNPRQIQLALKLTW